MFHKHLLGCFDSDLSVSVSSCELNQLKITLLILRQTLRSPRLKEESRAPNIAKNLVDSLPSSFRTFIQPLAMPTTVSRSCCFTMKLKLPGVI